MKTHILSTRTPSTRKLAFGWLVAAAAFLAVLQTGTSEAGWRRARRPVTYTPTVVTQRPAFRYPTAPWPVHNGVILHGDIKPVQYHLSDSPYVHHQ